MSTDGEHKDRNQDRELVLTLRKLHRSEQAVEFIRSCEFNQVVPVFAKMAQNTKETLKKCKYFRDVTWTYISYPDNSTQQIMHCRCPKNSVAYLIKRHAYQTVTGTGYQYSFACSPQTVSV